MPASNPTLAPLVTILSSEQLIYQALLDVGLEERAAVVDRQLPALQAALQHKQEILAKLAKLEDRRVAWLRRYARKFGFDLETITLAAIIESCEPADRQALAKLHRGLRRRIDKVVELNSVTSKLLGGVLQSVDASLRFLLADEGASQTYGAQGRLHQPAPAERSLLECRA